MINFLKSFFTKILTLSSFITEKYFKAIISWITQKWESISQISAFISYEIDNKLQLSRNFARFIISPLRSIFHIIFFIFGKIKKSSSIFLRSNLMNNFFNGTRSINFFINRTFITLLTRSITLLHNIKNIIIFVILKISTLKNSVVLKNLLFNLPFYGLNTLGVLSLFFMINSKIITDLCIWFFTQTFKFVKNKLQSLQKSLVHLLLFLKTTTITVFKLIINNLFLEFLKQSSFFTQTYLLIIKAKKIILKTHLLYKKALSSKKIIVLFAITSLLLTFFSQQYFFSKTIKTVFEKKNDQIVGKNHPFASQVNVHLKLDNITPENTSATIKGVLSFYFATGTECLDLMKQFQISTNESFSKKHLLTNQHNLVTTSSVFEIEAKPDIEELHQYYPLAMSKISFSLQNKSLFAQECNFIANPIEMTPQLKKKLNIIATKSEAGSSTITFNRNISMECPSASFSIFCQKQAPKSLLILLLSCLALLLLMLPLILTNTTTRTIFNVSCIALYLIIGSIPYFSVSASNLTLWNSLMIRDLAFILITQATYIYSSLFFYNKITRSITQLSYFIYLFLNFLFWFWI